MMVEFHMEYEGESFAICKFRIVKMDENEHGISSLHTGQ